MTENSVNPQITMYLGDVEKISEQDSIWAIRGKSIGAYSRLEQSLCRLFQHLLMAPPDRASIVFFKITSTTTRNAILEKLIRKQHGEIYNLFWNSYLKQLRGIDTRRNEIVHWVHVNNIHASGDAPNVHVTLAPPAFWDYSQSPPILNDGDLIEFIVKCDVYARLCTMFVLTTGGAPMSADDVRPGLIYFSNR